MDPSSTHMDDVMLNANDLFLFAQAVESGGFAPAARRLGLPKSTISKRVGELEARLGARLVHRTSRSFVLTDIGRDVYDHARAALIEVEGAEAAVQRRQAEPAGVVRLTASIPTVQFELAPRLPQLAALHPKLHVTVHATDRFVDIAQEGFDIAIRSHFAPLPDSGLVQQRLRRSRSCWWRRRTIWPGAGRRGTRPTWRPTTRSWPARRSRPGGCATRTAGRPW